MLLHVNRTEPYAYLGKEQQQKQTNLLIAFIDGLDTFFRYSTAGTGGEK